MAGNKKKRRGAIRARDIYQGRKKARFRGGIAASIILGILLLAILLFYGLRSYAVYDEAGNAKIVLPFSQKAETEQGSTEGD